MLLQKLGAACVAAYNASAMCADLPRVAFLAMDARHCAGAEMAEMMAYAAAVGSAHARRVAGAVGFVGCATAATAHFFGQDKGLGTMPHALIGYAGSTLRAAEMFRETFPDEPLTVLVDYFGQETSDAVAVCRRFPELAAAGRLAFRMDTPGGRYCEGLDLARSYEVMERNAPQSIRGYRTEAELRYLVGTGVTAAALWRMREVLNEAGFPHAKIVASSGFGPEKCRMMAAAAAPIDVIGTGSYLPELWTETYATADIIAYDGQTHGQGRPRVPAARQTLTRLRLIEAEGQRLQIGALGQRRVHRVVGGGAGVLQDAGAAAGIGEAVPHRLGEFRRPDIVGAGGEEQEPAGRGQLRRQPRQLAIAAQRRRHVALGAREGRRVGDDDVEPLAALPASAAASANTSARRNSQASATPLRRAASAASASAGSERSMPSTAAAPRCAAMTENPPA